MIVFSLAVWTWVSFSWTKSLPLTDRNKRSSARQALQGAEVVLSASASNPWPWDTKCPPHLIKGGCPYPGGPLLHNVRSVDSPDPTSTPSIPCTTQAAARARCRLVVLGDTSTLQFPPLLTATLRDGSKVCVAWSRSYSQTFTLFKGWVSDLTWLWVEGTTKSGRLTSLSAGFKNQLTDRTTVLEVTPENIVYGDSVYLWDGNIQNEYVTLSGGKFTINDLDLTVQRSQGNLLLSKLGNEFNYGEGIVGALGSWQAVNGGLLARSLDGRTYIKTRQTGGCRLLLAKGEDVVNKVISF